MVGHSPVFQILQIAVRMSTAVRLSPRSNDIRITVLLHSGSKKLRDQKTLLDLQCSSLKLASD